MPRIWNLTDRAGLGPAEAFELSGQRLPPGSSLELPDMPPHLRRLLASGRLVVGDAPPPAPRALAAAPATPAIERPASRLALRKQLESLAPAALESLAAEHGVPGDTRSFLLARLAAKLWRGQP